jgi:hypothetical protein
MVVAATAAAAAAGTAPSGAAAASSYCSPTGDYCLGAVRRVGVLRLVLDTFSLRGRVQVCVTGPQATRACRHFRLARKPHEIYGLSARWSAHYPHEGPGTYTARFRYAGAVLGEPVTFRVRG